MQNMKNVYDIFLFRMYFDGYFQEYGREGVYGPGLYTFYTTILCDYPYRP